MPHMKTSCLYVFSSTSQQVAYLNICRHCLALEHARTYTNNSNNKISKTNEMKEEKEKKNKKPTVSMEQCNLNFSSYFSHM